VDLQVEGDLRQIRRFLKRSIGEVAKLLEG
jgi:hypothetical protein